MASLDYELGPNLSQIAATSSLLYHQFAPLGDLQFTSDLLSKDFCPLRHISHNGCTNITADARLDWCCAPHKHPFLGGHTSLHSSKLRDRPGGHSQANARRLEGSRQDISELVRSPWRRLEECAEVR